MHAVNIWGYAVDKYVDVCELYIGDNNLPSSMNIGDGLANIAKYQESSNSYLIKYGLDIVNGQAKLINLIGAKVYGSNMNVLYELDLGKQYFKDYFDK